MMPHLTKKEQHRRVMAIVDSASFAEAADKLGGVTKEALQEWARDNPDAIPGDLYEARLTASDRQREHLERARGAPSTRREIPWGDLRFHCSGPCNTTYDSYQRVIAHRRGKGSACKGAAYTAVLPDEEEEEARPGVVAVPLDLEDDEELLRAIVATLDERDVLRERVATLEEQMARRRTVWSSVRARLLRRDR